MSADLSEVLSSPAAPDPQEIADAVKDLIATPAGVRPLRTVVGTMGTEGVNALNEVTAKIQRQFLDSLGA